MLDETVQAAILQLQAQLANSIGQMKDMARRRTEPADPGKLGSLALQAAQVQSAIQALQQLRGDLVEVGRDGLRLSQEDPESPPDSEPENQLEEGANDNGPSPGVIFAEDDKSES